MKLYCSRRFQAARKSGSLLLLLRLDLEEEVGVIVWFVDLVVGDTEESASVVVTLESADIIAWTLL